MYTPKPPWIEGTNHDQHNSYDPDAYSNRWREAWQAWALQAPEVDQRFAQQRFLEGVEIGWREKVLLEVNRNNGGPTRLADASEEEFASCLTRFREAYWPRWQIRSFKSGPFNADKARKSQQRLKQAWTAWADTLGDDNPSANVAAYVQTQQALLEHVKDLNRVDGYYLNVKKNLEVGYQFMRFDFEGLLQDERVVREFDIYNNDGSRRFRDTQAYEHYLHVEAARLEGDWEVLLELERPSYYQGSPPFGAEHYEYTLRNAAKNYDTHYFIWSMDRYFGKYWEPTQFFSAHYY